MTAHKPSYIPKYRKQHKEPADLAFVELNGQRHYRRHKRLPFQER